MRTTDKTELTDNLLNFRGDSRRGHIFITVLLRGHAGCGFKYSVKVGRIRYAYALRYVRNRIIGQGEHLLRMVYSYYIKIFYKCFSGLFAEQS